MQPILCTHCAQVVYRQSSTALHPTTLSILPGQLLVLLGSSGAGKSTLLRTLNGLVRPTAGTVEIPGIGSLADPAVLRQHRRTTAPRRFVWNPTVRIAGRSRARWACGQAAFEPVHMSTGRQPGERS